MDEILWWGYKHVSGSLQVKRYFSQEDLEEAASSDFVCQVRGPWPANSREEALTKLTEALGI